MKLASEQQPRWARNSHLARYLNVTPMTIWRWQRDPDLNFPKPSRVHNIDYTDLDEVDSWLRARAVAKTSRE